MAVTVVVGESGEVGTPTVSRWLKDALPRTNGAVRSVVKRELSNAVREFYRDSRAWRVTVGPKNVVANRRQYILSPYDSYSDVIGIAAVSISGQALDKMPNRSHTTSQTSSIPTHYLMPEPGLLELYPTPLEAIASSMFINIELIPAENVRLLPVIAGTEHYDAIFDGLLGRMYAHPAKPYSDVTAAQYHLKRFRNAIGKAAGAAKQGEIGAQNWRFPRFGK